MTYRKSKRRSRRRKLSGGKRVRRTKAQMVAARKAHAEARKNCPAGTRPLKRRTKDGRSCSRPRKSPRKSGSKRARRTKAQMIAARKAHAEARKNCPAGTRPLKHRTKDGRSCSKPRKSPRRSKKKSMKGGRRRSKRRSRRRSKRRSRRRSRRSKSRRMHGGKRRRSRSRRRSKSRGK
jgi:hypothetical protein